MDNWPTEADYTYDDLLSDAARSDEEYEERHPDEGFVDF